MHVLKVSYRTYFCDICKLCNGKNLGRVLFLILSIMTILWVVSIILKNVSIVDMFWGLGFVMVNTYGAV